MFLPLGDHPNYGHLRPWVNWALLAGNVVVWASVRLGAGGGDAYDAVIAEHGFVPLAPRLEAFFTSMFLHANFLHLAGNMLFLWVFGDNVEGRLGHVGYLLAYLACGLAAVLLFWLLEPDSVVPMVGASGAIFGIEGFYFVSFARNRVKVLYWWFLVGVTWIPARWMLGLSFVLNLLFMLSPSGSQAGGGVAYAAHVGGFVLGALLALSVRPFTPPDLEIPDDPYAPGS